MAAPAVEVLKPSPMALAVEPESAWPEELHAAS